MTFETDLTTLRYPGIARAALEMSYCNGGINRYRHEKDALAELERVLNDGIGLAFNLPAIDKWLSAVSDDDLLIIVDGEEQAQGACLGGSPDGTNALLNEIFEHAA